MTAFYSWTAVTVEPPPFSTTVLPKETLAITMFAPFVDSRETPATSQTTSTRGSNNQQNFKTMTEKLKTMTENDIEELRDKVADIKYECQVVLDILDQLYHREYE